MTCRGQVFFQCSSPQPQARGKGNVHVALGGLRYAYVGSGKGSGRCLWILMLIFFRSWEQLCDAGLKKKKLARQGSGVSDAELA